MESIRRLYRIGHGPSSSHTMGPAKAAHLFHKDFPDADSFRVVLYGSLAETGRGHQTDKAIEHELAPVPTKIIFDTKTPVEGLPHENTMDFFALKQGREIGTSRSMSVGDGEIVIEGRSPKASDQVYSENSFSEIADYCYHHQKRLSEYVKERESEDFWKYLSDVWGAMKHAINEGLTTTGILEGGLGVERKAQLLYNQRHIDESEITRENRLICAYAFAAGEQNAAGGIVVTAPTCGASAVVPSVLRYMQEKKGFPDEEILNALAVGGLIGNLVKTNASISGAECGCQAEIGTACSMASAALAELFEMGIGQIEYAAEVAMEHMLGLTCDPICGLVQIPCIERNAVAAMRAINAFSLANFLSNTRKISFDTVVETMYRTGKDMSSRYRETSLGGLAAIYR